MATNNGTTMFFLNNVRSKPKAGPVEIYKHFHTLIHEQQKTEYKYIQKVLDIIDTHMRKININTNDPIKQQCINEKYQLLLDIVNEIHNKINKPGMDFLNNLDYILKF